MSNKYQDGCEHINTQTTNQLTTTFVTAQYGLCAAVWTKNLDRAHRVTRRMETSILWVNEWFLRDLRTPFDGIKMSGLDPEGGKYSLDFYSEPTNVCIKLKGTL
jgi:acyl-CoA reductase-like NAD-dependent aldehyde dehydrogenase